MKALRPALRDFLEQYLQIAALSTFAFAQPLLDRLSAASEFFIVKEAGAPEIVGFVLLTVLGLPLLLLLPLILVRPFSRKIAYWFFLTVIAVLVAATLLPLFHRSLGLPGALALPLSLSLGSCAALLFWRSAGVRSLITLLSVIVVAAPIWFLSNNQISPLLSTSPKAAQTSLSGTSKNIPVVFVIFDEFPLWALQREDLSIDSDRYPNFAKLAATSTWYPNTTAASDYTTLAVPAILSGNFPKAERRLPISAMHPDTIFTALKDSHRMNVLESITKLCAPELCPPFFKPMNYGERLMGIASDAAAVLITIVVPNDLGLPLPEVHSNWDGFWKRRSRAGLRSEIRGGRRVAVTRQWIEQIRRSSRPTLHLIHTVLPHVAYRFYASGTRYDAPSSMRGCHPDKGWSDDRWAATLGMQQFLTQVGTADTLLGELVTKIKGEGIFDDALVIITADHGVTFEAGSNRRGEPDRLERFFQDIATIPLFIKFPGQSEGVISQQLARSIDIVPTVLDVLDSPSATGLEGRSLLEAAGAADQTRHLVRGIKPRDAKVGRTDSGFRPLQFPHRAPEVTPALREKLLSFGTAPFQLSPFELSEFRPYLARRLSSLNVSEPSQLQGRIVAPAEQGSTITVAPKQKTLPGLITVQLSHSASQETRFLLVLDDRVVAGSRPFLAEPDLVQFLIPEESLEVGTYRLRAFEIDSKGHLRELSIR